MLESSYLGIDHVLESDYQRLLNFAARKTGCQEEAKDIVQESYVRLLRQYGDEEEDVSLRRQLARLYLIARRLLIDRFRQQRRQPSMQPIVDEQLPSSRHLQPECQLMHRQEACLLLQAIETLPPRCREAFTRYKLEGQSQKEIAAAMNISVNMVEKHIIRGMLTCKQVLREAGDE